MKIYDYSKLKGRITEIYDSNTNFAKAMDMSYTSLSNKLNNKVSWTQREIDKAITLLNLHSENIDEYFFKTEIQKSVS